MLACFGLLACGSEDGSRRRLPCGLQKKFHELQSLEEQRAAYNSSGNTPRISHASRLVLPSNQPDNNNTETP